MKGRFRNPNTGYLLFDSSSLRTSESEFSRNAWCSCNYHNWTSLCECASQSDHSSLQQDLGRVVLKGLEDSSGWVILEACEVIFTVFDDRFDDVVKSLKMLHRLAEFGNYLQHKVKTLSILSSPTDNQPFCRLRPPFEA